MGAGYFDTPIRFATGLIATGAAIAVRDTGGTLADIFSNEALSVSKSNPGVVDADGRFIFYADQGEYDITVGAGASAATYRVFLGANTDLTFSSRAALVTWWGDNSGDIPVGAIISDGSLEYIKVSSSSIIPDLANLEPHGGNLAADYTVNVPDDVATLQEAFDKFAVWGSQGGDFEIIVNMDHLTFAPDDGIILATGGKYGHMRLTATGTVTVGASFAGSFCYGVGCDFPVLDCVIDMDGKGGTGWNMVNGCRGVVNANAGVINAGEHGAEVRGSQFMCNDSTVWTGAYDTGLRIQQGSSFRAQFADVSGAGHRGIYVSRGATGTVMDAVAQNCGLTSSEYLIANPGVDPDVSAGGLLVRGCGPIRANRIDVSGSYNGIAVAEKGLVNAPLMTATNCVSTVIRATGGGEVYAGAGTGNAPIGVKIGTGCNVSVGAFAFGGGTGTTSAYQFFSGCADLDISGATGLPSSHVGPDVNTLSPSGRVIDSTASVKAIKTTELRTTLGGTANAITLTTGGNLTSVPTGVAVRFRATSANTGATTINVDGIGAVACVTVTGAALPAGYIRTDVDTDAVYDGTNWVVRRIVERGSGTGGTFARFEDGTQICTIQAADTFTATAAGAIYRDITTLSGGWTFNKPFAAAPSVSVGFNATGLWGNCSTPTTTGTGGITLFGYASFSGLGVGYHFTANGRWY